MPNPKILIVEDSDDSREMLAELLRCAGYRVDEARNGLEAYSMLKSGSERPTMVLLDLMMPVMSGPELIELLATDDALAQLPIVIVSAAVDSIRTGSVRAALKKPIHLDDLLAIVGECCASNRPVPERQDGHERRP